MAKNKIQEKKSMSLVLKNNIKRGVFLFIVLLAVITVMFTPSLAADPVYNPGDIAVINAIIDNNGLNWTKADPADGSYVPSDWPLNWGYPTSGSGINWSGDATNKRIVELYINIQSLTGTLNVSGLANLQILSCSNDALTGLNVSGLTKLQDLICHNNALTELNVSGLTKLQTLGCSNNALTELNVSGLTNLQNLGCGGNALAELNVSDLTNLTGLSCTNNALTKLNVSGLVNLQTLECFNNALTELDVIGLTKLQHLSCTNNALTKLNVSNLTNLQTLYCDNNALTKLNVSGLTKLQTLYCDNNSLTELNVSGLTSLQTLYCTNNLLAELNASGLTKLQTLYCTNNTLTKLNVSGLTSLQTLYCYNNALAELNVSGLTKLQTLYCTNNALTKLSVSGLTNLQDLICHNNTLTELNVSGLTKLRDLNCYNNALAELNVSGLTSLQTLTCYSNALTELNVSGLTKLRDLNCYNNNLTTLVLNATAPYSFIDVRYNYLPNTNAITGRNNISWDTGGFYFSPQKYTVTFNLNGGTMTANQTVTVAAGSVVWAPIPAPTRTGYTFAGWYTDINCTVPYTFGYPVNSNLTLYAKWTEGFTITFDSMGGSMVGYNAVVPLGDTLAKPTPDPIKPGYVFAGWYIDQACTVPYTFGQIVTTNFTLYAKWTQSYIVTFNSMGGSAVQSVSVAPGASFTSPAAPTKISYTFAGWYTDINCTVPYTFGSVVNSDLTLYAKWTAAGAFTVIFDSKGGTAVQPVPVQTNGTLTKPTPDPTKAGFVFGGWYIDDACTAAYTFGQVVTQSFTLYAKWTQGYTITFNSTGGSTLPPATVLPGAVSVKPTTDPKRDNFIFDGWYIDEACTVPYTFGSNVIQNLTLYAKWIQSYTVIITGKVISVTGDTRPATITLKQNGVTMYTVYTNQNGEYVFNNVAAGNYTLVITKGSYLSYTKTLLINKSTEQNVTIIPGDIDGDGYVSYNDFLIFLANYNKQGAGILNPAADINGDGYVDYNDFITFLSGYGKAAVVEP